MKIEIGSYEAKTRLPELLREVQQGKSFTITNRGKPVADLVPAADEVDKKRAEAVRQMQEFVRTHRKVRVNIRELIEEGRD
jgi:prevent-host-death family protein